MKQKNAENNLCVFLRSWWEQMNSRMAAEGGIYEPVREHLINKMNEIEVNRENWRPERLIKQSGMVICRR